MKPPSLIASPTLLLLKYMTEYHKYASCWYTQFIFYHRGGPQRIEEMLMCPAAFIFGTCAGDNPALGPEGPHLWQNYSKHHLHANITWAKHSSESNSSADWLWRPRWSASSEAQRGENKLWFKTTSAPAVISVAASVYVNTLLSVSQTFVVQCRHLSFQFNVWLYTYCNLIFAAFSILVYKQHLKRLSAVWFGFR